MSRLLCLLLGHMPADGYAGRGTQYFKARGGVTDGIGRQHWDLQARCRWCDKDYYVGKVHGPLK